MREAQRAGELRALAQAYTVIDWAHIARGHPKRATFGQRALALYEELDDIGAQAVVTNNLGAQAYFDGRWDDAVEFYSRSRSASLRVGDAVHAAMAAMNLGEIFVNRGRLDEAELTLAEASRILRASGSDASQAAEIQIGRVTMERGRYEEAEAHLRRAHDAASAAGRQDSALEAAVHLADCRLRSGRADDALTTLLTARREARDASALWVAQIAPVEARALAAVGRFDAAREACRAGRDEARRQGLVFALALVLVAQVEVESLAGREPHDAVVATAAYRGRGPARPVEVLAQDPRLSAADRIARIRVTRSRGRCSRRLAGAPGRSCVFAPRRSSGAPNESPPRGQRTTDNSRPVAPE